jgi:hypothetical protein
MTFYCIIRGRRKIRKPNPTWRDETLARMRERDMVGEHGMDRKLWKKETTSSY